MQQESIERNEIIERAYIEWSDFICNVASELAKEPDILSRTHKAAFERIIKNALYSYRQSIITT